MGLGIQEVRKIFDGIAAELSLPKATNVSAPKYPAEINNELKKYLKQKNYKAFAVSAGGRFGVMTGQTTEEIATREALAYCRRYAGSKDGQTCRLIMVGDHLFDSKRRICFSCLSATKRIPRCAEFTTPKPVNERRKAVPSPFAP